METMTFVSGKFKDTLGGARPMRDDEKAYVQGLVTKMYERFVGIVSESRKIDLETHAAGLPPNAQFTSMILRDDAAQLHGHEALGDGADERQVVLDDEHGAAGLLADAPDGARGSRPGHRSG